MVYIGKQEDEKKHIIKSALSKSSITKVFILTTTDIDVDIPVEYEVITFKELIQYAYYYRIIEETTKDVMIIINEPLFTSNRSDLTYNCIRIFLNSTKHILTFSYLPILNTAEDFAILLDFDTRSLYKGTKLNDFPIIEANINAIKYDFGFEFNVVETSEEDKLEYNIIRDKIIKQVDKKGQNPDVIPRNIQLSCAKFKKDHLTDYHSWLFRNDRYSLQNSSTFRNIRKFKEHIIFDIPFNNSDLVKFIRQTGQTKITFLISDLPIEQFFKDKMLNFLKELNYVYTKI